MLIEAEEGKEKGSRKGVRFICKKRGQVYLQEKGSGLFDVN
jgi:hypothetical protein